MSNNDKQPTKTYASIIEDMKLAEQMANHHCTRLPTDLRPCGVCLAWVTLFNELAANRQNNKTSECHACDDAPCTCKATFLEEDS